MSARPDAMHHTRIQVHAFIESLLAQFESTARVRHVTLDALVFSDCVELNAGLLRCLLTDLVGNALRRAPAGTHVSVAVLQRDRYTEFRVADEGAGVEFDEKDSVFDAVANRASTVGHGLTFCKLAAAAIGGQLSVSGTNNRAIVCITFPREGAPASSRPAGLEWSVSRAVAKAKTQDVPSQSGTCAQVSELSACTARPTILLVEDEPLLRASVRRALTEAQYDVLDADCAERAFVILTAPPQPISLLLSDVVLPGASGPELVRKARLLSPELPALLMSANNKRSLVADGMLDEETYLLQKPFAVAALIAKVAELLPR